MGVSGLHWGSHLAVFVLWLKIEGMGSYSGFEEASKTYRNPVKHKPCGRSPAGHSAATNMGAELRRSFGSSFLGEVVKAGNPSGLATLKAVIRGSGFRVQGLGFRV